MTTINALYQAIRSILMADFPIAKQLNVQIVMNVALSTHLFNDSEEGWTVRATQTDTSVFSNEPIKIFFEHNGVEVETFMDEDIAYYDTLVNSLLTWLRNDGYIYYLDNNKFQPATKIFENDEINIVK